MTKEKKNIFGKAKDKWDSLGDGTKKTVQIVGETVAGAGALGWFGTGVGLAFGGGAIAAAGPFAAAGGAIVLAYHGRRYVEDTLAKRKAKNNLSTPDKPNNPPTPNTHDKPGD